MESNGTTLMESLWLLPLLPLCGAALCGLLHYLTLSARRASPGAAGPSALAPFVACAAMLGSFAVAVLAFLELRGLEPHARVLASSAWDWIRVGDFSVEIAMLVDPLSAVLVLVVTGVGSLIHVYSVGYMRGDPGYAKFFAFLNLFVFAMLMLVGSSSLLGLFIGWEGVGLCSYLLIGFWYEKGWPAEAAQKAFVVNRIGDACFLVGSFLLVDLFGTLDLRSVVAAVPGALGGGQVSTQLALAGLLLFGGACGKSAQIPLFTWLPDAMAGPTPVSALIHAATMVTAGVYMIVRLNPLYAATPELLLFVGLIGTATALLGASTALAQRDIKKVLAYSTVSQLGFMFLALGAGAFASAIFHLVTHAFFKGLLFLGAGSVIHGMHGEQDMHAMGGLRRHMPVTHWTFLAGAAALSGLPLLSGYFSKDEILAHELGRGGPYVLLWTVGVATAALTAFYTWRMVALTFYGEERFDRAHVHPHESPGVMTLPLAVLAVLAVAAGLLNLPPVLPWHGALAHWLEPVTQPGEALLFADQGGHAPHMAAWLEWGLLALGALVAVVFAHKGFHAYRLGPGRDAELARARPAAASFLENAWNVDALYAERVVRPLGRLARLISTRVDAGAIDGLVNGSARAARDSGRALGVFADGSLRSYALWIGTGAALISLFWMWS